MRACVIFNPTARGEKAQRFRDFLGTVAAEADLRPTTGPGAARPLAREAVASGHDQIIAAGGDGTAFEVLNGIAEVPGALERVSLGVLPLGTANVLALTLGMPGDIPRAWEALRQQRTRPIDCGLAEYLDLERQPTRAHFAIVAGAGLDARAVQLVDWQMKKRTGKLAYIASAMRALWQYPDRVRCTLEGRPFEGRAVLISNGPLYAGNLPVFRDGAVDSGCLHVRAVRTVTPNVLLRSLASYLTRRWYLEGRLVAASVREIQLEAASPTPLQLDGEFAGWLPARLRVLPGALRVLVP